MLARYASGKTERNVSERKHRIMSISEFLVVGNI
jgi:hypothetical protein